jgi:hypothetical protein
MMLVKITITQCANRSMHPLVAVILILAIAGSANNNLSFYFYEKRRFRKVFLNCILYLFQYWMV